MKKIICTVPDNEVVTFVSALVGLNADFSVETVSVDGPEVEAQAPILVSQEEAPPKVEELDFEAVKDRSRTGLVKKNMRRQTPKEAFIAGLLSSKSHRIHKSLLGDFAAASGFSRTTFYGTARKLVEEGTLKLDGKWYILVRPIGSVDAK